MRIKERNRQQGALARAEIEEEGFFRSQEEGADHDRMKLFRKLGVRSLESKILGLIGVEPYPALPGGIVFEAAKFLERPFQPRVVQDPVMKPHRLEVLTRQRSQKRLIRHFRCLTKSRNLRDFPQCQRPFGVVETKADPFGTMADTPPTDHPGRSRP